MVIDPALLQAMPLEQRLFVAALLALAAIALLNVAHAVGDAIAARLAARRRRASRGRSTTVPGGVVLLPFDALSPIPPMTADMCWDHNDDPTPEGAAGATPCAPLRRCEGGPLDAEQHRVRADQVLLVFAQPAADEPSGLRFEHDAAPTAMIASWDRPESRTFRGYYWTAGEDLIWAPRASSPTASAAVLPSTLDQARAPRRTPDGAA